MPRNPVCDGDSLRPDLRARCGRRTQRMFVPNLVHRFRLASLVCLVWLVGGALSSCTPQPTNLSRNGADTGTTPFGVQPAGGSMGGGTTNVVGGTGSNNVPGGTNEGNQNISGGLSGG